jgi:hypothetical protein
MPKSPRVRPWDRISLPPWLVVVAGLVLPSAAQEPHSIRHWGAAQGADVDLVLAIAQTPDGFLWFGSPSGLFRCNGHAFHSFDPRSEAGDSSAAISVTALLTDRAGALWIGTQFEGLYRMHQGRNETFRAPQGLDNDRIKCLLDRANGSLLVGTDGGGLFQRPTGRHRFEPFAVDAEVKLTHPTALAEARMARFGSARSPMDSTQSAPDTPSIPFPALPVSSRWWFKPTERFGSAPSPDWQEYGPPSFARCLYEPPNLLGARVRSSLR